MLNIVSKSQHGMKNIQFIFLNQTFIGYVKRKVIYLVNQAIFRQTQIKVILRIQGPLSHCKTWATLVHLLRYSWSNINPTDIWLGNDGI